MLFLLKALTQLKKPTVAKADDKADDAEVFFIGAKKVLLTLHKQQRNLSRDLK